MNSACCAECQEVICDDDCPLRWENPNGVECNRPPHPLAGRMVTPALLRETGETPPARWAR